MTSTSRRQFNHLALAALSGTLAGSILGCSGGKKSNVADNKGAGPSEPDAEPAKADMAATAKTYDENLLLAGDPHVCRGLNQCKNQGKSKMNECAGQGDCATAEKHACDGLNTCKGQGGCGEHPGQNQCKGQGACAVVLKDKTWDKARAKFEELMTAANKKFGPAPAKG
jgi:hypothetical protein